MSKEDIRWHQRFSNYKKAFAKLDEIVTQLKKKIGMLRDMKIVSYLALILSKKDSSKDLSIHMNWHGMS